MANSNYKAALAVIAGKYGNGEERIKRLWEAGFNPQAVQTIVNALMSDNPPAPEDSENILEIEVDLSKYDGINLIFKESDNHDI